MNRFISVVLVVFTSMLIPATLFAAVSDLDGTFDPGTGADNSIFRVVRQSDGKVLIGGTFTTYNGTARNGIARANADGSLDATFDPGAGVNANIRGIAVQADGKIIIGGDFSTYDGTGRTRITRINADGSIDNTFNVGTGFNNRVYDIIIQPDNKIVVVGHFNNYNGTNCGGIIRLNTDGSVDGTFNAGTGADSMIADITLQANGKFVIGGIFTAYNGTGRVRVARLNADGSLDNAFNPALGADNEVSAVAVQADGKIYIGGYFLNYNGTAINKFARLNADGTLDGTFNVGNSVVGLVFEIDIQTDGKIIIAGNFTSYNGTARTHIARINTDGTIDTTLNNNTGPNGIIRSIALQPDEKILIGGQFTSYDGIGVNRIARLHLCTPPPVFSSAFTASGGGAVEVKFNKPMADPTGKHGEFTVNVNGAPVAATAATLKGGDATTIVLTLAGVVTSGQTVTVSYTAGTVTSVDGGVLATFAAQPVRNSANIPTLDEWGMIILASLMVMSGIWVMRKRSYVRC